MKDFLLGTKNNDKKRLYLKIRTLLVSNQKKKKAKNQQIFIKMH